MELKSYQEDRFYIIALAGDLDAGSSISLDNALEEAIKAKKKQILIDCQGLNYISSPGIGVLTSRLEDCESTDTTIVLYAMSEKIYNVFTILGLDQVLPIKKSKEDAKLFSNDI